MGANHNSVAGSIFSEKVSAGGQKNNKIKSLTTRVDSSIVFDDEKGSIRIKDKKTSDSKMTFDGKKNIVIEAGSSVTVNVGNGASVLRMDSKGNIDLTGTVIRINAKDYLELEGKNKAKLVSGKTVLVEAAQNDVTITGSGGKIKVERGEVYIN
jgi:hypothetical protein